MKDAKDPLFIQNVQTYCYLTICALDAPSHGKIHIKTEINVLHLSKLYNEGSLKSSEAHQRLVQTLQGGSGNDENEGKQTFDEVMTNFQKSY